MASNNDLAPSASIILWDDVEATAARTSVTSGVDSSSASSSEGGDEGEDWWNSTAAQRKAVLSGYARLLSAFSAKHLIIGPERPDASKQGRFVLRSIARRLVRS